MAWFILGIAIVAEVIATSALKESNGFSNFTPSVLVILGYGVSFYGLSIVLKTIPVGVAYAIWSGIGIILISLLGWLRFNQKLDTWAIIGILCISIGVLIIQLFSKTVE